MATASPRRDRLRRRTSEVRRPARFPILYNDHHVYTKPDVLKQGRVLAALVKGGTILIPLRSMFEQMGATVSYDAGSKTATVSKAGRRGQGDRRQAGSHHQRRIASAGRSAGDLSGRRRRCRCASFPKAWARTCSGFRTSDWSSCGTFPRRRRPARHRRRRRPLPRRPRRRRRRNRCYGEAFVAGDYIISPKVYNEFSPGNTGQQLVRDPRRQVSSASEAFRSCSKARTSAGSIRITARVRQVRPAAGGFAPNCYVTTIGGPGNYPS